MKRLHLAYMCCWLIMTVALGALIATLDDRNAKDSAPLLLLPILGMTWHYARSKGRSPAWMLMGCWGLIILSFLPDRSRSSTAPAVPRSSVGRIAFRIGDPVLRAREWLYEKVRYHPRDPDPPPGSPSK